MVALAIPVVAMTIPVVALLISPVASATPVVTLVALSVPTVALATPSEWPWWPWLSSGPFGGLGSGPPPQWPSLSLWWHWWPQQCLQLSLRWP